MHTHHAANTKHGAQCRTAAGGAQAEGSHSHLPPHLCLTSYRSMWKLTVTSRPWVSGQVTFIHRLRGLGAGD